MGWVCAAFLKDKSIMSWIYLIVAGLFEIGWPIGLKMAQELTSR
jgi:hypothetical protein